MSVKSVSEKGSNIRNVIVTGGAGFIGSEAVRTLVRQADTRVLNIDNLTYAGNLASIEECSRSDRYEFAKVDICNSADVSALFTRFEPDVVLHFAAESHVDRSIDSPGNFIQTNVVGTYNLLESSRRYLESVFPEKRSVFRFLHVSTDEVFGSLGQDGFFSEQSPYDPRSPYSASKAASDHLVRAWYHTYQLPIIVTNCSNNYGPYQFPEKLIPLTILKAIHGADIPVYGNGQNIRDWLYVSDHVDAILSVLKRGQPGDTYNIGSRNERTNLEVVTSICGILDELIGMSGAESHQRLITFVPDRPGHDLRYAIDPTKILNEIGWQPKVDFSEGMKKTVSWYLEHRAWWEPIWLQKYGGSRLGAKNGGND